jgi:hypothetical protein
MTTNNKSMPSNPHAIIKAHAMEPGSCCALTLGDAKFALSVDYLRDEQWHAAPLRSEESLHTHLGDGIRLSLHLTPDAHGYRYRLEVNSEFDTRVRLRLQLIDGKELFHLIPCNIHGDNNIDLTGPGEYPHLTGQFPEDKFCVPLWELRADRAALPVSVLCHSGGAIGISIAPYSDQDTGRISINDRGFIRNGVFSELPDAFGVSLGYGNIPGTFIEKRWLGSPTRHLFRKAEASGHILGFKGDRRSAHRIMRTLYAEHRELPEYRKTIKEAIAGVMDAWLNINWGPVSSLAACRTLI